jgi:hypothetical protein
LLACNACDETSGGVHADYLRRHRETFVFRVPQARIVEGLRGLFAERGLELLAPATGDTLQTSRGEPSYDATTEYTIHLIATRSGTLVRMTRSRVDRDGKISSASEAEDLPWQLAERLEPDRALAITEEANRRADDVAPRAKQR